MSRTFRRRTVREGRGLGDYLSESFVYVVAVVLLFVAGKWYFVTYRHSPSPVLSQYVAAIKSGDVEAQYRMLAATTKSRAFPTQSAYQQGFPPAQGLTGRIADFTITKMTEDPSGDRAVAEVTLAIRDAGQKLYQAGSNSFKDVYVLRKESGEWRVALEESWDRLNSRRAASTNR